MENKLICIAGPTASGKTALSVYLAKKIGTEIVSADSMQIYKKMNVGTAKPTKEEMSGIIHHMIDICDPSEEFSVAKYVQISDQYCQNILEKNKIPIVVGGTGLYMNALIEGSVFSGDEKNTQKREELCGVYEEKGAEYLHSELRKVDNESAERIHPNNVKRVIRALEVYYQTGLTINELNRINKNKKPKYDAVIIGVCPSEREVLYNRINKRVDEMINSGLLEEAKYLIDCGYITPYTTAGQAIGYKEFLPYFSKDAELDECVEKLKQNSRNYAKRQITWLKRDERIHWVYYNDTSNFSKVCNDSTNYLIECGVI